MDTERSDMSGDDRRIRFEARRLAIESFVKIHLEHVSGTRQLVMNHLKLMFTLSLGALAGVMTLYGAVLRFGGSPAIDALTRPGILLGFAALASLIGSALLAARGLQLAATEASRFMRDPVPGASDAAAMIFTDPAASEARITEGLFTLMSAMSDGQPTMQASTWPNTILLVLGLTCAGASFLV